MKAYRTILLAALMAVGMGARAQNTPVDENPSPTEGVITHQFVDEGTMMADLLQMLANSMTYAKNIWYNCQAPNSVNEPCGFFKANSAGQSNEDGVRTNADFSMICAFLYKYAQGKATLPEGLTWAKVKDMAMKSLVFGYSTHKANKLKVTSNNAYWGSTATNDVVWESSLWAMSLAYASFFLADELSAQQKDYIYKMLKANLRDYIFTEKKLVDGEPGGKRPLRLPAPLHHKKAAFATQSRFALQRDHVFQTLVLEGFDPFQLTMPPQLACRPSFPASSAGRRGRPGWLWSWS